MLRSFHRRHSTEIAVLLLAGLLTLSVLLLPAHAETETQTRYFLATGDTIQELAGLYKKLWATPMGLTGTTLSKTFTDYDGGLTFYTGVRVYTNNANATQTQLTTEVSAIASIVYTGDWESISASWTCPQTNMSLLNNVAVKVYVSTDNATWTQVSTAAQWNTESLLSSQLLNVEWTFHYYVYYDWDFVETATYWFAMLTNNWALFPDIQPRIENFQFTVGAFGESEFPVGLAVGGLFAGFIGVLVLAIKKKR